MAVEIINQDEEQSMGLVQVPSVLPRLVEVEGEGKRTFVFLEDIIIENCHDLFNGCQILDVVPFRLTRDSDLDVDEDDIDNLLKEVEKSLRKRKRGAAVRLELNKTANLRIKNSSVTILIYQNRKFLKLTDRLMRPVSLNLPVCLVCGRGSMSLLCRSVL